MLVPIVFLTPIQSVDLRHFLISQRKVIQLGILPDKICNAGAGDDHHALLEIPPKDHLSGEYTTACSRKAFRASFTLAAALCIAD